MKSDCEAVCLFCRERISYQDRERKYFMKHLKRSHSIKYNLSYVIAINFLGQESRDIIVTKFEESSPIARTGDTDDIHVVENENTKNSSFTKENGSTGMEYAEIEIDDDDDSDIIDIDKPNSLKVSLDNESFSKENEIKHILMEDNPVNSDLSEKDENNDATSKDNSVCSKLKPELEVMRESCPMDVMEEESKTDNLSDLEKVGKNSGTILSEIKNSPEILSMSTLQNGEEFEEESKAKCDICKKAVSIVKKLMNHAESHAKKNETDQKIKDEHIKIPLTSQLIKLATMTEKFTSACVMCQKVEGTIKKLRMHTKTHKKKCVFLKEKCEVNGTSKCDEKVGFNGSSIKREMGQVNDSLGIRLKKFDIKIANIGRENKDIIKNSTAKNILKSQLDVDEKIIKCENCNKLFNHPENLNKHFKMYPDHRNIKLQNESDEVTDNMRDQIAAVLGL